MTMNENLYACSNRVFPPTARGRCCCSKAAMKLSYAEADAGSARYAALFAGLGARARRPRRRAGGEVPRGVAALPRLPARGPRLPAAEQRVPGRRDRLFPRQRRARAPSWRSRARCRGSSPSRGASASRNVFSLDEHGQGTLLEAARGQPGTLRDRASEAATTSPPSSTPRAPRDARRARCSPIATSPPTRSCCTRRGGSGRTTCWCTCCRSSTSTASSSPATACSSTARAMRFHAKFDARASHRRLRALHGIHGRADVLHAPPRGARPQRERPARTCASSSRAPRRCSPKPTWNSSNAPDSESSSATA